MIDEFDDTAFDAAFDATEALQRLREALPGRAEAAGLLDVAVHEIDSPVGPLLLAATESGLVRVAFEREGFEEVLQQLATTVSPRILKAPDRLQDAATQLGEYFAGTRRDFELPLDRRLSTGFRGEIQKLLPRIGYGRTVSYRELAELAGRPTAVRAVGTACATNPLPLVVPCHRVLRSDGSLGGYLGGLETKTALLELERAA